MNNATGNHPALDDADVARLLRAIEAVRPPDRRRPHDDWARRLGDTYGVSARTIYRYAACRVVYAEVEGWRVPFLVRPGQPPSALSARATIRPARVA